MPTSRPGTSFFASPLIPNRPFLRFVEGAGAGAAGGESQNGGDQQTGGDLGFPANTSVTEMTPEQQAAYWKHQSRRHEARSKAFGELTPEQVRTLQTENQQLKTQGLSDQERAVTEAEERGRAAARAELEAERVTHALDKALAGRTFDPMALLTLDRRQFVKDGRADADAIKTWVDENSTAPGAGNQQQRQAPDLGQGRRGTTTAPATGLQAGRDLYTSRNKTTTTSTS